MTSGASALIGHTGFVGGNIKQQTPFSHLYNSKNIEEIRGHEFDLVVCAGVRAEMWIANQDPQADMARIQALMDDLAEVKARHFVLISTVAVYPAPRGVDEDSQIDPATATAYGTNRYAFEQFCAKTFASCTIVRLPGLFGQGLKKNVIYDFLHSNNLDRIDSRGVYQFYDLSHLWEHIEAARSHGWPLLNLATEPTSVAEVVEAAFGQKFDQTIEGFTPANYDMWTKYAGELGGQEHYIYSKAQVLEQIKTFVQAEQATQEAGA